MGSVRGRPRCATLVDLAQGIGKGCLVIKPIALNSGSNCGEELPPLNSWGKGVIATFNRHTLPNVSPFIWGGAGHQRPAGGWASWERGTCLC